MTVPKLKKVQHQLEWQVVYKRPKSQRYDGSGLAGGPVKADG